MDVRTTLFSTLGGLALFLFGVKLMSTGLKKMGSQAFKRLLNTLTKHRPAAIFVGIGITCLIQSSSATSVMVVGLVNAGLLVVAQAIAVVLGADVGTTITAWLVSALGIGKFKISEYALPVIFVGFVIHFLAKNPKRRMLGQALLGFGLLFLGLGTMSEGMRSIRDSPLVVDFFTSCGDNPILGILAGTLVTALVQSSSVVIAIIQLLGFQGVLGLEAALPLMLGANIGTTVTAQIAAIGGTRGARAVAMGNTFFKAFGVMVFLPLLLLGWYEEGVRAVIADQPVTAEGTYPVIMVQIAFAHTAYVCCNLCIFATVLWPALLRAARWAAGLRGEEPGEGRDGSLDPLLLDTPSIAMELSIKELTHMTRLGRDNINAAYDAFLARDLRDAESIADREDTIDEMQKEITAYLVELSRRDLSEQVSKAIPRLIHAINDAERVGDHAENIVELTTVALGSGSVMDDEARRELQAYHALVDEQFEFVLHALETKSRASAHKALVLEGQINSEYARVSQRHTERLEEGACTVQAGILFLDMITNLEKIADHLTNIVERLETEDNS